jgi:hypothetical protein
MSDNPLDRIRDHDRISFSAVVVKDGEDPGPALAAAGIFDPVALPVTFGEPDIGFGDGITPALTAVLEGHSGPMAPTRRSRAGTQATDDGRTPSIPSQR